MERALNKEAATFGDALRRAEGMQCLSYREQAKTYWRLSRFFLGADIPYRRMRKLLLFRELPVGNDEVSFVKGWEAYRALLEERHDRIFAELCSPIGAFAGPALTDLIGSDYDFNKIDLAKAGASAGIAFGLSWFPSVIDWGNHIGLYQLDMATNFTLLYENTLLSISNSVVNVWWRGKKKLA